MLAASEKGSSLTEDRRHLRQVWLLAASPALLGARAASPCVPRMSIPIKNISMERILSHSGFAKLAGTERLEVEQF